MKIAYRILLGVLLAGLVFFLFVLPPLVDDQANAFHEDFRANAEVVAMARNIADLGDLPSRPGWRRAEPRPGVMAWTDDYSDLIRAILRKKFP